MSRLVLINAADMENILFKLGFARLRKKGSHVFYQHPDGRTTTIPFHGNRDLPRPLLRDILREININVDEYNELR
ncbi:MAG: type II toxin-antitoxin system HicA family toxin [Oscillospiraceae bacterium]|nr:type II toxin-antitoxin system HicA family toxin [Oscillospiraceae bacterium]